MVPTTVRSYKPPIIITHLSIPRTMQWQKPSPHHQPTKIFSSVGQDFLQPMHLSDALLKSEKHLSKHNYLTSRPRNTGPSSEHASPPCYPSKATSSDEGGQSRKNYLLLSLIHAVLKLPFKDQDKRNKNKRATTLGSFFPPTWR